LRLCPRTPLLLFGICVVVYSLSHYGGIRSPDGEVYYLSAEALADRGSFAVEGDLRLWAGFGLAPGVDGERYSIFGPAFPVAAAPLVLAGKLAGVPEWADRSTRDLPPSFYSGNGLASFLGGEAPAVRGPWAIRSVASSLNILITALCVCLFFSTLRALGLRDVSAYLTATIFGLGTLVWSYAGMFLSEPLATLTALASFFFLVRGSKGGSEAPPTGDALLAGLCLGVSVASHISSFLFLPFFLALAVHAPALRTRWAPTGGFVVGFSAVVALLGYHHYAHFGNPLETGRTVDETLRLRYGYGDFVAPWPGLVGLLVSPAKGLLLYCPAAILGLAAWPLFHRTHRRLSLVMAGMILFRIGFLAFRSDWHGGFCLGPRYLVAVIPFLLMPCGIWLDRRLRERDHRAVALGCLLGFACIAQQLYFSLGEIYSFFTYKNYQLLGTRERVTHDWGFYFEWDLAPLTQIWKVQRGPFLLQDAGSTNGMFFALGTALVLALIACGAYVSWNADRSRPSV
jgi:hypothetical protein